MVEAALAPRSSAIGRTLADIEFQSRYGLLALALWREGEPQHVDLARSSRFAWAMRFYYTVLGRTSGGWRLSLISWCFLKQTRLLVA